MKIVAENFKGIEYVQLNQLPEEQRVKILKTLNANFLIKIMIDGKVVRNCLQYKDYDFWFDNIYSDAAHDVKQDDREFAVNLAFQD